MDELHGLLAASTERNPGKAAFVKAGSSTSYAELEDRAARLAAGLASLGVGRGDRVAIVLDGDVDYLVAFYGVLRAGAAAVPLCPDTRTGPLVHALAHSGARAVILDAANLRWLDGHAGEVPALAAVIVRGGGALAEPGHLASVSYSALLEGPRGQDAGAGDDDLAALVYTSGTTGRPKGVMLSHRNLVANTRSIVSYLELGPEDIAGMVLPFYYVYGNSVLHTHIAAGATIAQVGSMTFVAQAVEALARFRCTGLSGVPATFARLSSFAAFARYDLGALRYLTQAGAAMTPALVQKLRELFPGRRIFVMYGQTEASARLSYLPPERLDDKLGSAGMAIPGVTLRICDPEGRVVPSGQVGEVVAEGANVMLGYWQDPEATARTLRPEGLRTGDIGHMDEDGFLYLHGRESELIKSGGHRISPAEIENAIAPLRGVHEVAVCGVPDVMLGQAIAAFIVSDADAATPLTRKAVLDACHQHLPQFKMPTQIRVVASLPRTENGKLKRATLVEWAARGEGRLLCA
jgi:acyl-CoA synthetase (AMP-forming)/AMP-acid ligase II